MDDGGGRDRARANRYAVHDHDRVNPDTGNLVYDGVEVSRDGEVVAYHVCSHHPWEDWDGPV